jgi:hypothetical protein
VPVTARLSKLFYERLGEEIANELVEWFNSLDATYKAELRDLIETRFARLEAILDGRFGEFGGRFDSKLAEQSARFDTQLAEVREFVARRLGEQTRWYYVAWAIQMAGIVTILLRLFLR